AGAEVGGDDAPGLLVEGGRLLGEGVDAAMDVGVLLPVIAIEGVDHRQRLLGGGAVVEVGERLPVDLAGEDGELRTDLLDAARPLGCRGFHHAAAASTSSLIQPKPFSSSC